MARLPDSLPMQGPNGRPASGSAVDFGGLDRALQGVGREIERFDQARRKADDEEAGRILEETRQGYELEAVQRAGAYDGRDPGFAERELAAYDAALSPLLAREDLSDGVRDALSRQTRDLRGQVGGQAIRTEASARAQRSAADRDAADQASAIQALMDFQARFDDLEDTRRAGWDGASPGYADGVMSDFRATRDAVLEGLAPAVAERLRPMLLSREASLQAQALSAEDEGRDAATNRTVVQALTALTNRARRDPAVATRFEAEAEPILNAAPAHLRERLRAESREQVHVAALEGRIESGSFAQVRAEIEAGRYDWMDPGRVEALRRSVESADRVRTVEDAQAEADLEAEIAGAVRAVLNGEGAPAGLVRRAQEIGGPDLAVRVDTDLKAAQAIRPLMTRLRAMTPGEADAELARMTAGAGDAVGARSLELAQEMVAQDRRLRADPAAWANTSVGPGDRVAMGVAERRQAFEAAPSPATAQAYARSVWQAQMAGGVPQQQRRILTTAEAESWIATLDEDGAAQTALPQLAARAALFGPGFQPQVLRELSLAGLSNGDMGALVHYAGSARRMGLYSRARGQKLNDLVPDRTTREQIEAGLSEALEEYQRIISSERLRPANVEAARVVAYGMVSRGESVRDAVRTATAPMADAYEFQDSWAVPKAAGVNAGRVRGGSRQALADLMNRDGAGLYGPPSDRYTPAQARQRYRDQVRARAEWRNLADDSGLQLMMPDADGRWVRVRDAQGRDVVRTWAELEQRGGGRR